MSDATNMGNMPGIPVQEAPNQMPSNDQGHQSGSNEAIPVPPPGASVPPPNDPNPPEDRNPRTSTPTGLRDFEGRRLYFANVCSTVSPHALHCIFRSYGPIRTFHYDTTLHYGYVVYLEREQALLARYGVDGLILGSRAIRVYYPPFKPRHPTRYCYNCREMGHFIQNCPYTNCNNWEYNYSPLYNQGQPVIDHMNHPSSPMMQHYAGHMIPPSQFMFPTGPVSTMPGQPGGSATLMYQPGWPGVPTSVPNMPFMPPFMGPVQQPMPPQPVIQQQMHLNHQLINQTAQPSAPPMTPFPVQAHPQLHPNINAMIQEQATAIIQQHIPPMVQQVVSQIMQDPAMNNLQQPMMQPQNTCTMDPQTHRPGSYTVNEEPDSGSLQSGSMTMQHGSYTAMEEPRNPAMPQNVLAHLMQNLPMQDSDPDYMDLGKMMQFAAQTLLQDDSHVKEPRAQRCAYEVEEPVNCCPVHNTPLTRVQKPANTTAQQSTSGTKTTTMHNGSTTTPRPQQFSAENVAPTETQTRNTSSTESHLNTAEEPMQSVDNQYYPQYPYQAPFSLPSSIFFTLPPIVVNITSPASYMSPTGSTTEQPKGAPPRNLSENYDFIQENERNLREFEEVVRDDEQNYVENEQDLRVQMSGPSETPKASTSKRTPPSPISERERQRQDRLKLRAMLMDGNDNDIPAENNAAMIPVNHFDDETSGDKKLIYSELISTMNTSCSEIEKLFTNLSSLVGNPLARKYLDQIRTKSEADILKLSQQLLHKIVDKNKLTDKEEIMKLSNDLMQYAKKKLPLTSEEPGCEGAVGGVQNAEEIVESSRSECDSRKDDSDDGHYRRKNHWKKNKKRRR